MPTIVREDGWAVEVFTRDHPPPHVHVRREGCEVKVSLPPGEAPAIVRVRGGTAREAICAVRIVERHREALERAWRSIHG
jgi:hypothetical protein